MIITRTPFPMYSSTPHQTQDWNPTILCEYRALAVPASGMGEGGRTHTGTGLVWLPIWLAIPGPSLVSSAGTSSVPTPWPMWPAAPRVGKAAAATNSHPVILRPGMRPSSEPHARADRRTWENTGDIVTGWPGPSGLHYDFIQWL